MRGSQGVKDIIILRSSAIEKQCENSIMTWLGRVEALTRAAIMYRDFLMQHIVITATFAPDLVLRAALKSWYATKHGFDCLRTSGMPIVKHFRFYPRESMIEVVFL